jgi:hypothetical protein
METWSGMLSIRPLVLMAGFDPPRTGPLLVREGVEQGRAALCFGWLAPWQDQLFQFPNCRGVKFPACPLPLREAVLVEGKPPSKFIYCIASCTACLRRVCNLFSKILDANYLLF